MKGDEGGGERMSFMSERRGWGERGELERGEGDLYK